MIGPVVFAESSLASRVRFHQAWYRAAVLRIESYGSSPSPKGPIARGSVLPVADAQAGKNFISKNVFDTYLARRAQGWGVDPVRCTSFMTSSQTLTFNVFGPLLSNSAWFCRVLSTVLDMDVHGIDRAEIEYAPARPSLALGDKTRLDLWMLLQTDIGTLSLAVEVKYVDRFNSRYLPVWTNTRYQRLLEEKGAYWDFTEPVTRSRTINQLLRCHALSVFLSPSADAPPAHLLVLHHPDDQSAQKVVDEYVTATKPHSSVLRTTINTLFDVMLDCAETTDQRITAHLLFDRYVKHDLSEASWQLSNTRQ
ncbi:PGN_0703 family putative restriction endonuclease [Rhodococcus opacus]|nr:hypothetical protein [Rhodococcus opacus]